MIKLYEQFSSEIEIQTGNNVLYTWTGRYNNTNEFFTMNGKFHKPINNSLLKDMLYLKKFGTVSILSDESITSFNWNNRFLLNIRSNIIDKYGNNLYHMIYFELNSYDLFIELFEKSISTINSLIEVNSFSDTHIKEIYKYAQKNI